MKRRFRYRCLDQLGRPAVGELAAESREEAEQLAARWGRVLGIEEIGATQGTLSAAESVQVVDFVAELVEARLPLADGLLAIAADAPSFRLRQALTQLAEELQRGVPLGEACHRAGVPPTLERLLMAGTQTGRPEVVVHEYAQQARSALRLRFQVLSALAYPLFLLAFGLGIAGVLLVLIVPQFETIFSDFGTELPWLTRITINLSQFVQNYGLWCLLGAILAIPVCWFVLPAMIGRLPFTRMVHRIPLMGGAFKAVGISRFCHLLAISAGNRASMPDALRSSGLGSDNAVLEEAAEEIAIRIEEGDSLSNAAEDFPAMPPTLVRLLHYSRNQKSLSEALRAIGDWYAQRARTQGSILIALLEPVIVLSTGFLVMLFVFALFMPLIKLLNDLS